MINTQEITPSVVFSDDKKYESHLRNTIAVITGVVERGEDLIVEAPLATRLLLDFYQETLRRHLLYYDKEYDKRTEA